MLNHDKMPGAGSVADTIEFMKQMWGSMGAPSMVTPSLSVDDLNKKIADLKTVASWLELNMNMLKATIQTMEVQSATLSTLQAMSEIMASREGGEPADAAGQPDGQAQAPAFPFPFAMWATPPAAAEDESAPAEAAAEETEEEPAEPEAEEAAPSESPSPDFSAAMANPNAWWNVLQEQFKQAVGNALVAGKDEEAPVLKPAKARKRSENKTVSHSASAAPKAPRAKTQASPVKGAVRAKTASQPKKTASSAKKVPKSALITRPSGKSSVVQSRPNKKPATRKPTSP